MGEIMRTQTAVLSTDANIKRFLEDGLKTQGFHVCAGVNSILDISKHFQASLRNTLILDTDTIIVPPANLRALMEKHDMHIILLGIRNAAPYLINGVKGAFSKPAPNTNSFGMRIFLRNIIDRIELYLRSHPSAQTIDSRGAVAIGGKVLAIAASTGGPEALHALLTMLPAKVPPILIVQHMPSIFTHQFATRLDKAAKFSVSEASAHEYVRENHAFVAPGDLHMKAVSRGGKLGLECFKGDKLHGVRPAADVLFESMAEIMGPKVIGVVLTGMGADGAKGLFLLKKKGATVIAQNKETCVVYGMPKVAVDMGIVDHTLPLDKIAAKITEMI